MSCTSWRARWRTPKPISALGREPATGRSAAHARLAPRRRPTAARPAKSPHPRHHPQFRHDEIAGWRSRSGAVAAGPAARDSRLLALEGGAGRPLRRVSECYCRACRRRHSASEHRGATWRRMRPRLSAEPVKPERSDRLGPDADNHRYVRNARPVVIWGFVRYVTSSLVRALPARLPGDGRWPSLGAGAGLVERRPVRSIREAPLK